MLSLRSPVNEKNEKEECKYVEHVGVQLTVMHAGKESGDCIHSLSYGLQEDSVHYVGLFTLAMNRSSEVNCNRIAGIFCDDGQEDCLEDHTHRV